MTIKRMMGMLQGLRTREVSVDGEWLSSSDHSMFSLQTVLFCNLNCKRRLLLGDRFFAPSSCAGQ